MRIKILKTILLTAGVLKPGEIVNLSDSVAIDLVNAGYATPELEEHKKAPKAQAVETEKPKSQKTEVKHASKAGSTSRRVKAAPKS